MVSDLCALIGLWLVAVEPVHGEGSEVIIMTPNDPCQVEDKTATIEMLCRSNANLRVQLAKAQAATQVSEDAANAAYDELDEVYNDLELARTHAEKLEKEIRRLNNLAVGFYDDPVGSLAITGVLPQFEAFYREQWCAANGIPSTNTIVSKSKIQELEGEIVELSDLVQRHLQSSRRDNSRITQLGAELEACLAQTRRSAQTPAKPSNSEVAIDFLTVSRTTRSCFSGQKVEIKKTHPNRAIAYVAEYVVTNNAGRSRTRQDRFVLRDFTPSLRICTGWWSNGIEWRIQGDVRIVAADFVD